MFLFDIDRSPCGLAAKQAIQFDIDAIGAGRSTSTNWYDFLSEIDIARVRPFQSAASNEIDLPWDRRLTISYRLLLGRTPEVPRFADDQKPLSDLIFDILTSAEFAQTRACLRYLRGAAFNSSKKLIVLHVPRTGGTYLSGALRRIVPLHYADCYDLAEQNWMLNAAFSRVFSAHFSRSLYRSDAGHLFVAAVRAPKDRFLSRARFHHLSSSSCQTVPSFLLDEALEGFQSRFILGDDDGLDDAPGPNTVIIPFEKIGSIVGCLYESGLCPSAPDQIFRNKSTDIELLTIPPALMSIIESERDEQLREHAKAAFCLPNVMNQLTSFLSCVT